MFCGRRGCRRRKGLMSPYHRIALLVYAVAECALSVAAIFVLAGLRTKKGLPDHSAFRPASLRIRAANGGKPANLLTCTNLKIANRTMLQNLQPTNLHQTTQLRKTTNYKLQTNLQYYKLQPTKPASCYIAKQPRGHFRRLLATMLWVFDKYFLTC